MESIEIYHGEHITLPLKPACYEDLRYSHRLIDVSRLPRARASRFHPCLPILWTEGYDLLHGEQTWVPYESVYTRFTVPAMTGAGCFPANSSGLASGNHRLEAASHAIYEVVERDAITLFHLLDPEALGRLRINPETVDDPPCREMLDRSYALLLRGGTEHGVPSEELDALRHWLPGGQIDLKREDAIAMLRLMRARLDDGLAPKRVTYTFECPGPFAELRLSAGTLGPPAETGSEMLLTEWVIDELRLDRDAYTTARRDALLRVYADEIARITAWRSPANIWRRPPPRSVASLACTRRKIWRSGSSSSISMPANSLRSWSRKRVCGGWSTPRSLTCSPTWPTSSE